MIRSIILSLFALIVASSLGACSSTYHGMKKDTGEVLENTGEAMDNAGEEIKK